MFLANVFNLSVLEWISIIISVVTSIIFWIYLFKIFIKTGFWKYLIGSLLVIIASSIGQLPLLIAVIYKMMINGNGIESLNHIDQNSFMTILEKNTTLFLMLLSFVFALASIPLVLKLLHNQKLKDIITPNPTINWNKIVFAFSIWAIFSIFSVVLDYYLSPADYVFNFNLVPFLILALIAILLIPIQTSVEELVFRGYLMQGFTLLSKNRWFPLLMTSLIFGGMHYFNPEVAKIGNIAMVYYIGTGLFLGIITLMDDGLELALGFHAANNLVGALLVTTDWTVFQTHSILKDVSEPSAGLDIVLPVVIVFPILLFIFSKKYKWTDWKEKLTGSITENANITNL